MKIGLYIKKFFKSESSVKILSIGLAIFLWIFVNEDINPILTSEISVPLNIRNENFLIDNGYTLVNKIFPKSITVVVKGRKQKTQSVAADNIDVFLDLDKVQLSTNSQSINVDVVIDPIKLSDGIYIDNYSPKTIELLLEKTKNNLFKVEVQTKGEVNSGYKLLGVTSTPEKISLQGGTAFLNQVGRVVANAELTGIDKDVILSSDCRLLDKAGKEINSHNKNYSVMLKIEVAKEVSVVPVISGKPANDYVESKRIVTPPKVLVRGEKNVLDALNDLRTEIVDIEGSKENVKKSVKLLIPAGVTLVENISDVNVEVEVIKTNLSLGIKD